MPERRRGGVLGNLINRRGRAPRVLGLVIAVAWLCVMGVAAALVVRENGIAEIERRLDTQDSAIDSGAGVATAAWAPSPHGPARLQVIDALFIARQVQADVTMSAPERRARLSAAITTASAAYQRRPFWGEASTVIAFSYALRDGEDAAQARTWFARSYDDIPFLRYAAPWRVQYGLRYWALLSLATRMRVVEEAVWLSRMDETSRASVFQLARSSPAYRRFILRWLSLRSGDADFTRNAR